MELKDVLNKRRSIRSFLDKEVEEDLINELLLAAKTAPSAANKRPWEFYVVTNKEILIKLKKASKYTNYDAPLVIIVAGNPDRFIASPNEDYWVEDTSAATQNILLRATDLGLGACWCGIYPQKENIDNLKKIIDLGNNIPLNIIFIGYPSFYPKLKKEAFENNIHYIK